MNLMTTCTFLVIQLYVVFFVFFSGKKEFFKNSLSFLSRGIKTRIIHIACQLTLLIFYTPTPPLPHPSPSPKKETHFFVNVDIVFPVSVFTVSIDVR